MPDYTVFDYQYYYPASGMQSQHAGHALIVRTTLIQRNISEGVIFFLITAN